MPFFQRDPDLRMHYEIDDFTDPWRTSEAVLLLHGNFESSLAWYGWAPALARHLRVVRADMRGFGESSEMRRDFPWTMDLVIDDFVHLLDSLALQRCHLVGAKIGGTIARAFAARRPDRVLTLTVVGSPPPARTDMAALHRRLQQLELHGQPAMEEWVRGSMRGRLGGKFPEEAVWWWTDFMCRTSVESELGFHSAINMADITDDIPRIHCPTLVITNEGSSLATVEETRAWQQLIPNSTLLVLPGDSYHVAVTDSADCAQATLNFIKMHGAG